MREVVPVRQLVVVRDRTVRELHADDEVSLEHRIVVGVVSLGLPAQIGQSLRQRRGQCPSVIVKLPEGVVPIGDVVGALDHGSNLSFRLHRRHR